MTTLEIKYDHELSEDEESAICNDIFYNALTTTFRHGTTALAKQDFKTAKWWLGRLEYEVSLLRPIVVAIINNNPRMTDYDKAEALKFGQTLVEHLRESIQIFEEEKL